jgi:hypothetical protein
MSEVESQPEVTPSSLLALAQTLSTEDQWTLLEDLLAHLKGAKPKKSRAAAKPKVAKDPDAPKRALSPYMELLNKVVWPVLKELSEKTQDPEERKLLRVVGTRTKVASALYAKSKVVADHSQADILSTYRSMFGGAVVEAKAEPKAEEPKPKAAPKLKVKVPEPEPEPEADEVQPEEWEHDFGDGSKAYERVVHEGKSYVYDIVTKEYLGAYNAKKNALDSSVPDILA